MACILLPVDRAALSCWCCTCSAAGRGSGVVRVEVEEVSKSVMDDCRKSGGGMMIQIEERSSLQPAHAAGRRCFSREAFFRFAVVNHWIGRRDRPAVGRRVIFQFCIRCFCPAGKTVYVVI